MVFGRSDGGFRWFFFSPGQRKYYKKVGDGSASSVVTAPLNWIGRNFPEAPPALWQKTADSGEEQRVIGKGEQGGDHLLLELLEQPTPYYSGSLLWMATVIDFNLSGNSYWIKIRDSVGRPIQLWWTPSTLIEPQGDENTFITHYEYRVGGVSADLKPENVVHFRYSLDPENQRKGKSPLSALLQEVFTDTEAADFTAALLGNMGVPGVVVSPKADSSPTADDVKATKDYFKEAFTGDRRGEPVVMSGPTSVTQFGFSPQQLALREIRRIPEERVSAALGVPAIVAGLGAGLDRSTFTNYSEARQAAYDDNIIPAQRLLSEDIRLQLLPDFQPDDFRSYRFGFDLSNVRVLQEDRMSRVQRLNTGVQGGWVRVSEARRAEDLEVEDADEVYLRAVNMVAVPVGEAAVPAPAPDLSPGSMPVPPITGSGNGNQPVPETVQQAMRMKLRERQPTLYQSRLVMALTRDHKALSAVLAEELEADFERFGGDCAETYMQMAPKQAKAGDKAIDSRKLARLIAITLGAQFTQVIRRRFERHVARTIGKTVDTINHVVNLDGGVSDPVQKDIITRGGTRVGLLDLENVTKESLFNTINAGNEQGLDPKAVARSIRDLIPAGPYPKAGAGYRAQVIARTETMWAQNRSSLATYRESPVVSAVIAMDGSDDPECASRNGSQYNFDEAEIELDMEHPNGTLCFTPVIGQEVPA